jgi:hypothetical protein
MISPQMLERTGQGLRDLSGDTSGWMIRQAMILPELAGELRLQKKISPSHDAITIRGGQTLAHASLEVMAALVGRIDPPEPRTDRQFGQSRSSVFLPRATVKEVWDWGIVVRHRPIVARAGTISRV